MRNLFDHIFKIKKNKLVLFILCFLIGFSFIGNVLAWDSPGSTPPEGNRPTPLNVSDNEQQKTGNFFLKGDLIAVGGIYMGGNIDLGVSNRDTYNRNQGDILNTNRIRGYDDLILWAKDYIDLGVDEQDVIWLDGSNNIIFKTGGTEKMRITSAGMGVATTTASSYALNVGGDINLSGTLYQDGEEFSAGSDLWQESGDDIYYNDGNVGIGTTSPDSNYKLTTVDRGIKAESSTSSQPAAYFNNSGGGYGLIVDSGNVGIGTTSPLTKLHVQDNNSGITWTPNGRTAAIFEGSNAGTIISLIAPEGTAQSEIWFGNETVEAMGRVRYEHDTEDLSLWTNNSEQVTIDSSGNVGIGTTGPGAKLQINEGGYEQMRIRRGSAKMIQFAHGTNGFIMEYSTDDGSTFGERITVASGGVSIGTADAPPGTNKFWVDGNAAIDGNVGIGTTSPNSLLNIEGANNGDSADFSQLYIKGTGTYPNDIAGIVLDSAGSNQSHIRFHNNGSPKFQIRYNIGDTADDKLKIYSWTQSEDMITFDGSNGNVGIGTTSPGDKLDVTDGTSIFQGTPGNANQGFIHIRPDAGQDGYLSFTEDTVADRFAIGIENGTDKLFFTSGTTGGSKLVTIQGDGNVGIGTTSPGAKLDVRETGENQITRFYSDDIRITSRYEEDIDALGFYGWDETSSSFTNFYLGSSLGTSLFIQNNGNVGIGTTGPGAALHIKKNAYDGILALDRTDNSNVDQIVYLSPTYTGVGETALDVNIGSSGKQVRIQENGNVGIGTTSPDGKLEIELSDTSYWKWDTGNAHVTFKNNDASAAWGFKPPDNSRLDIDYNDADFVTIDNGGNVGIGTTSPGKKLEVNGGVYANGGWFRVSGTKGLYFQSYGGGWHMQDSTWVRSYSGKQVYSAGHIKSGSNMYADAFYYNSDRRAKEDIKTLTTSTENILKLNPVQFKFKEKDGSNLGFIAQDVEKIFPELISTDASTDPSEEGMMKLNYSGLIAPLVKTVQEQHSTIQKQEEEIKELNELYEEQQKQIELIKEQLKDD